MFFTASAEYLRWYLKDTIKRAKNISSLIFFTASAEYLRWLSQRYNQTSKKYKLFNIFYSECRNVFYCFLRDKPRNRVVICSKNGIFAFQ